jgi:bifunctional non-homologous end joining protein LigD
VHDVKHDGYRMICRRDGARLRVFSRRGKDWTARVPFIVEVLRLLRARSATIVRAAVSRRQGSRGVFLYAFDLIELDG